MERLRKELMVVCSDEVSARFLAWLAAHLHSCTQTVDTFSQAAHAFPRASRYVASRAHGHVHSRKHVATMVGTIMCQARSKKKKMYTRLTPMSIQK